jgi:cobaltochelatase CobN
MILFITNADTEILTLRSLTEGLPAGFPTIRAAHPDRLDADVALDDCQCVIVRLLGGRGGWQIAGANGFDAFAARCTAANVPLLAFGGEAVPDAELAALSTVSGGIVSEAFGYLAAGGPGNLENLLRFVADTVLMEGFGFVPPASVPDSGMWDGAGLGRPGAARDVTRPLVAVIFYRAHLLAGNTQFVADLCAAIQARGADALALYCYSLRPDRDGRVPTLDTCATHGVDVIVTTVLAMGGAVAGAGTTGGAGGLDGDAWDVGEFAALNVAVIQAPACSMSAAAWAASDAGLSPIDVAMGVAGCELDGRIIAPPFAFKELVDDGDVLGAPAYAYRTVPDRAARVAGLAFRAAALRRKPAAGKKIVIVLSAYPTKRSRLGNAVGLDTPASAIDLLHALADAGHHVSRIPADGDTLMAELADGLVYEAETLNASELAKAVGGMDGSAYADWFATLPQDAQDSVTGIWGPAPGTARLHNGKLVFSGIDLGDVLITIQPPRGYGDDPIAVYHSPTLPPAHHYLAFYRWLDQVWGADAVVHLGKHGTLEWLPGKSVGLSGSCFPDAAIGDMPFFYPFVVNDPGEGTQAKRRAHAVVIDHLQPPMTRAETYDDLAKLEQLLDEHAQLSALDPKKLPAQRVRIWELMVQANLNRDLGLDEQPEADFEDDAFDDLIGHVDGYLCELKDAQIRGGLHVMGRAPADEALIETILAATRLPQGQVPSLRAVVSQQLGVDLAQNHRVEVDAVEAECRRMVSDAAERGWISAPDDPPTVSWICDRLVPQLSQTTDEVTNLLHGLAGGYVPSGPSGALTRGGAHVLPTGRNFYSVDPKALPTQLSWQVGQDLASALLQRHLDEEGTYPRTVGIVLWGTAAMRTQGDDVAEVLALLGVRPVWEAESRRVVGLEAIPLAELGRPRMDVTVRISGFFRDAFPNLVALLDDAVQLVAALPEDAADNAVRASGSSDARVFGPAPGGYGSGILSLLEGGNWRTDDDLAAVYIAWSGHSYGRSGYGVAAEPAMRRRFAAIEVAVKNQDNREHDIFDSDDYMQDHGGMIATIRALSGKQPKAWFGDSADPANPRVRALAEEAARVVRSRVINPRWIEAMERHGYKGAFEMAATVDYLFGYDATAQVVEDWMYERVTEAYVADPDVRKFFEQSNPWALRSIAERLLEANERNMWQASDTALATLRSALLEAEGWEERR